MLKQKIAVSMQRERTIRSPAILAIKPLNCMVIGHCDIPVKITVYTAPRH